MNSSQFGLENLDEGIVVIKMILEWINDKLIN